MSDLFLRSGNTNTAETDHECCCRVNINMSKPVRTILLFAIDGRLGVVTVGSNKAQMLYDAAIVEKNVVMLLNMMGLKGYMTSDVYAVHVLDSDSKHMIAFNWDDRAHVSADIPQIERFMFGANESLRVVEVSESVRPPAI